MRTLFDAMHHGKYEFDDFMTCTVEENYEQVAWSGRTIFKPSKKLKAFHSFLNSFLFEHLPVNDRVAFAYRKGTNPHHALLPHAKSRAFYQTDLTKFFDRITSPLILRAIQGNNTPIADLEQHLDRVIQLVTIDGRLPIGFSTSPAISNTCLKPFDDQLENYSHKNNIIYTRYADDIILSAENREQLSGVEENLIKLLAENLGPEFQINRSKSKLTTVGRKIKVLGMVVLPTGHISIEMETKKKIEYQLHYFVKNKSKLTEIYGGDLDSGLQQLAGHISHINSADPIYLEKLRKKYGTTVIDSFLHRTAK